MNWLTGHNDLQQAGEANKHQRTRNQQSGLELASSTRSARLRCFAVEELMLEAEVAVAVSVPVPEGEPESVPDAWTTAATPAVLAGISIMLLLPRLKFVRAIETRFLARS